MGGLGKAEKQLFPFLFSFFFNYFSVHPLHLKVSFDFKPKCATPRIRLRARHTAITHPHPAWLPVPEVEFCSSGLLPRC